MLETLETGRGGWGLGVNSSLLSLNSMKVSITVYCEGIVSKDMHVFSMPYNCG